MGADTAIRSGSKPPRSFSLTNLIAEFIHGNYTPEKSYQPKLKKGWCSTGDLQRTGRVPYAAMKDNPGVPVEFHMPVHYPRFTEADYKNMPEWQMDRLLEEYGLPPSEMGSIEDKREYAIGAFLWK